MEEDIDFEDLEDIMEEVNNNAEDIGKNMYPFLLTLTQIISCWNENRGEEGWSKCIPTDFNDYERKQLEDFFVSIQDILGDLKPQKGGKIAVKIPSKISAKGFMSGLAKKATQTVKNTAKSAVNQATGAVTGAVQGAVDQATGAVQGAVDQAQSAVTGAVQGAVDQAQSAVQGAVTGAVQGAVDQATGAVPQEVPQEVPQQQEVPQPSAISDMAGMVTGALTGQVDQAKDMVTGAVKEQVDQLKEQAIAQAKEKAMEQANKLKEKMLKGKFGKYGKSLEYAQKIFMFVKDNLDPKQISIDWVYYTIMDYLDNLDNIGQEISAAMGLTKFQHLVPPIPLQPFGIPYEIGFRQIIPITSAILDIFRTIAVLVPLPTFFLYIPAAIFAGLLDIGRGNIKNAILSFMGIFGAIPTLIGVIGKVFRNLFSFMAPNISIKTRNMLYKSAKSTLIGMIIWTFTTFAPEPIYRSIEVGLESFKAILEQVNTVIGTAESMFQGDTTCYDVEFRYLKTDEITIDTLYNIQELLNVPEIYCNPNIQEVISKMSSTPPIRLIFDLMNIPTVETDLEESCKGIHTDTKTLADSIIDVMKPVIKRKYPIPAGCPTEEEEDEAFIKSM